MVVIVLLSVRDETTVLGFFKDGRDRRHMTPDLQIIGQARKDFDTAVVLGFRMKVDFQSCEARQSISSKCHNRIRQVNILAAVVTLAMLFTCGFALA